MLQAEVCRVLCQRVYLLAAYWVGDGLVLVVGGSVVVGHTDNLLRTETAQTTLSHPVEGLWRRYFMTVETVNVQLCGAIGHVLYHVGIPDFVE